MKNIGNFFLNWLGWWLLVTVMINIPAEVYRYCIEDFDFYRGAWVCFVESLSLLLWWKIMRRKRRVKNAKQQTSQKNSG